MGTDEPLKVHLEGGAPKVQSCVDAERYQGFKADSVLKKDLY